MSPGLTLGLHRTPEGWAVASRPAFPVDHSGSEFDCSAVSQGSAPFAGILRLGMEPGEAVNTVESVLRAAIREVLEDAWRDVPGVDVPNLEKRRVEEGKRRNGAVVDEDLLTYTDLWDLQNIVVRQWEQFKPLFKDQSRFKVYMGRLEDFRNVPIHSRTLLPFERDLLSGIAGEFRNGLTLWRSERAPDMSWYPRIESVTDSLGNSLSLVEGLVAVVPVRLQVGELLTFRCIGWDPQDRELTWTLNAQAAQGPEVDRQAGGEVTLTWKVQKQHVAEHSIVVIQMMSTGRYHRQMTGVDASVTAFYTVEPPH
jgi:hypothetical protein